jgi:predicted O-methyltransferase YrrM
MWPTDEIKNTYSIKWHPLIAGEYVKFWEEVYSITKFKNLFEIGFNAGHTSHHLLKNYNVTVTSVDIAVEPYTSLCANLLKNKFKNRFTFIKSQSQKIIPKKYFNKFDIVYIDGCHDYECIKSDLQLSIKMGIDYIVFDDIQFESTQNVILEFKEKFGLNEIISYIYKDCEENNNIISLYKTNIKTQII